LRNATFTLGGDRDVGPDGFLLNREEKCVNRPEVEGVEAQQIPRVYRRSGKGGEHQPFQTNQALTLSHPLELQLVLADTP